MRPVAFVSLLAVPLAAHGQLAAQSQAELKSSCLIDSTQAVSDAMDAAMYMWAAVSRCGKPNEEVKCSVGILSTVESVNSMINVILESLHKCGDLATADYACGLTASKLTENAAGLGAEAAAVQQHCPKIGETHNPANPNFAQHDMAECTINVKDTFKELFNGVHHLMTIKDKCKARLNGGGNACTTNALDVIAAFAGMGGYLAGALGHCTPNNQMAGSVCADAATELIAKLVAISKVGIDMSEHCGKEAMAGYAAAAGSATKYSTGTFQDKQPMMLSASTVFAAWLPATAIISFVGGRWYAKRSAQRSLERVIMSDEEQDRLAVQ